jgi:outer membrane protein assembly factor BamB
MAAAAVLGTALLGGCTAGHSAAAASSHPARAAAQGTAPATDWPGYLDGPLHTSYSPAQTTITPADAMRLVNRWHDAPGQTYLASPTVADGAVFIGSNAGWFYQLNISTGAVEHKAFLGYRPQNGCNAHGIVATATVAVDPLDHQDTVYVAGADGYLYAFSAANLALKWKSVIAIPSRTVTNYYAWASPAVANGAIYVGVSSDCTHPFIRGGVISYDQATGQKIAEFSTVPKGHLGASVWSSIAVGPGGYVYATTGNSPGSDPELASSDSILKLAPDTLKLLSAWQVPAAQALDFGGSPVIFGPYVGACNKNGIFYALRQQTMRLAWERRVGATEEPVAECLAAPVYDGRYLYLAGPKATISGKRFRGSIQKRLASNGSLVWQTGLPEGVVGSPTMDGGGVVAVGTYDDGPTPNATYLVDAATGKILRNLVSGWDFGQSVFADGCLFTANTNGVYAWGLE